MLHALAANLALVIVAAVWLLVCAFLARCYKGAAWGATPAATTYFTAAGWTLIASTKVTSALILVILWTALAVLTVMLLRAALAVGAQRQSQVRRATIRGRR